MFIVESFYLTLQQHMLIFLWFAFEAFNFKECTQKSTIRRYLTDSLCCNPVNPLFPRGKLAEEILEQPKVESMFSLEGHSSFIFRKNHSSCFLFKQTYIPFSSIGKTFKTCWETNAPAALLWARFQWQWSHNRSLQSLLRFNFLWLLVQRKQSRPTTGPPVNSSISKLFINSFWMRPGQVQTDAACTDKLGLQWWVVNSFGSSACASLCSVSPKLSVKKTKQNKKKLNISLNFYIEIIY